jgi:hypothetical protein
VESSLPSVIFVDAVELVGVLAVFPIVDFEESDVSGVLPAPVLVLDVDELSVVDEPELLPLLHDQRIVATRHAVNGREIFFIIYYLCLISIKLMPVYQYFYNGIEFNPYDLNFQLTFNLKIETRK